MEDSEPLIPSLTQFSSLMSDASCGSCASSHLPLSNPKRGDDATLVAVGTGVGGDVAVGMGDATTVGVAVGRGVTVGLEVAVAVGVPVGGGVAVGRLVAAAAGPGVATAGVGVRTTDVLGCGSSAHEESVTATRAASRITQAGRLSASTQIAGGVDAVWRTLCEDIP